MANSKTCERCGANLDFGERCSCSIDNDISRNEENKQHYRVFPKYSDEQKLEALSRIRSLIK